MAENSSVLTVIWLIAEFVKTAGQMLQLIGHKQFVGRQCLLATTREDGVDNRFIKAVSFLAPAVRVQRTE